MSILNLEPGSQAWISVQEDPLLPPALAALGVPARCRPFIYPTLPTMTPRSVVWYMGTHSVSMPGVDTQRIILLWQKEKLSKPDDKCPEMVRRAMLAAYLTLRNMPILRAWRDGRVERPALLLVSKLPLTRLSLPSRRVLAADISRRLAEAASGEFVSVRSSLRAATSYVSGRSDFTISPEGALLFSRLAKSDDAAPVAVRSILCAAALSVVGASAFGVSPEGDFLFHRRLAFHPLGELDVAALVALFYMLEAKPELLPTAALPGFPPGEHPFLYGVAAGLAAHRMKIDAETSDPNLFLTSRTSARSAVVSLSLMDSPREIFREHVRLHLR